MVSFTFTKNIFIIYISIEIVLGALLWVGAKPKLGRVRQPLALQKLGNTITVLLGGGRYSTGEAQKN